MTANVLDMTLGLLEQGWKPLEPPTSGDMFVHCRAACGHMSVVHVKTAMGGGARCPQCTKGRHSFADPYMVDVIRRMSDVGLEKAQIARVLNITNAEVARLLPAAPQRAAECATLTAECAQLVRLIADKARPLRAGHADFTFRELAVGARAAIGGTGLQDLLQGCLRSEGIDAKSVAKLESLAAAVERDNLPAMTNSVSALMKWWATDTSGASGVELTCYASSDRNNPYPGYGVVHVVERVGA